jgi:hypothetical protein
LENKTVYINGTGNKVSTRDLRHLVLHCNGRVCPPPLLEHGRAIPHIPEKHQITNRRARADILISAAPEVGTPEGANPGLQVVREDVRNNF